LPKPTMKPVNPIRIAVASGKGGTGKTTVAASLALSLAGQTSLNFLDCDVEAPNAHLLLNPQFNLQKSAVTLIPEILPEKCNLCGKCVEVCQFHALAKIGKNILVFPQLCHGCGSCTWNCPQEAIREKENPIGELQAGSAHSGDIQFARGLLTIAEPMPTPVIRQLKRWLVLQEDAVTIYDSPPGASCSVVETLRGVDFVILVTEPTPFGLHDLKQIIGILNDLKIPSGVVINRDGIGEPIIEEYLLQKNIPILMRIPFSTIYAAGIAAGKTLVEIEPDLKQRFLQMYETIKQTVGGVE